MADIDTLIRHDVTSDPLSDNQKLQARFIDGVTNEQESRSFMRQNLDELIILRDGLAEYHTSYDPKEIENYLGVLSEKQDLIFRAMETKRLNHDDFAQIENDIAQRFIKEGRKHTNIKRYLGIYFPRSERPDLLKGVTRIGRNQVIDKPPVRSE